MLFYCTYLSKMIEVHRVLLHMPTQLCIYWDTIVPYIFGQASFFSSLRWNLRVKGNENDVKNGIMLYWYEAERSQMNRRKKPLIAVYLLLLRLLLLRLNTSYLNPELDKYHIYYFTAYSHSLSSHFLSPVPFLFLFHNHMHTVTIYFHAMCMNIQIRNVFVAPHAFFGFLFMAFRGPCAAYVLVHYTYT